jgi:hypothetical protein
MSNLSFELSDKNPFMRSTTYYSPLDQFEIREFINLEIPVLFDIQLSLTNIGMYLCLGTFIALSLNVLATNANKIVANS